MPTPSPLIVQLLAPFAVALTRPALAKLAWLVQGGILAPGRRTVCAAVAACGLGASRHFGAFHRFFNPVRSEGNRKVHCRGIRWLCACLLVRVPWSARPWALPFFVVPVLAAKVCQRLGKAPRSHFR